VGSATFFSFSGFFFFLRTSCRALGPLGTPRALERGRKKKKKKKGGYDRAAVLVQSFCHSFSLRGQVNSDSVIEMPEGGGKEKERDKEDRHFIRPSIAAVRVLRRGEEKEGGGRFLARSLFNGRS